MDWNRMQAHWPNSAHSTFIQSGGIRWHVQQMGQGPDLLLIHGAGGATQSWRTLMPLLAKHYRCTAMDLPGQGFTPLSPQGRAGLDVMAQGVQALTADLGLNPVATVAHSAGVPIALRIHELNRGGPPIVAINAALSKFDGVAGWLFPLTAKVMAAIPFSARLFAAGGGNRANIQRLLKSTGSKVTSDGLRLYGMMASDPAHVGGTLRMMADWALDGLMTRLPQNDAKVHFIVGDKDGTVPPEVSVTAAKRMQNTTLEHFDLGHLAHEEAPAEMAEAVMKALK